MRALFVVNMAFQREVVELAQRFEMDYDFVPLLMVQRYKPELMEDILRNQYDVIVTSALLPDNQMEPFTEWPDGLRSTRKGKSVRLSSPFPWQKQLEILGTLLRPQ